MKPISPKAQLLMTPGLSLEAMDELFGVTEADAKRPLAPGTSNSLDKHREGPGVTEVSLDRKEERV